MEYIYPLIITCPTCSCKNKVNFETQKFYNIREDIPFVMLCDNEEGGCDNYFVAQVNLKPDIKTFVLGGPQ